MCETVKAITSCYLSRRDRPSENHRLFGLSIAGAHFRRWGFVNVGIYAHDLPVNRRLFCVLTPRDVASRPSRDGRGGRGIIISHACHSRGGIRTRVRSRLLSPRCTGAGDITVRGDSPDAFSPPERGGEVANRPVVLVQESFESKKS